MGNGLGLHDAQALVYADVLVHLDDFAAALWVAGDNYSPVGQGIGVQLGDGCPGGAGSRIQGNPCLGGLFLMFFVGLPEPPAKVGLKVIRHTSPGFQKLFISADAALNIGLVGTEEGLHGLGGQFLGGLVVFAAKSVDVVAPKLVDERPHRVGVLDGVPVNLHVVGQNVHRVGSR